MGWGAIGRTVARIIQDAPVEIVAVGIQDPGAHRTDLPDGAALISDPSELAGIGADLVAEAASRDSVGPWGRAALKMGADFLVSSVSALADPNLLESLRCLAVENCTQLQIHPGALGGIDALSAARSMGLDAVEHTIVKPPGAWLGTPAETMCRLHDLTEPTSFYTASAADTAALFPKNANVAMTTALAGIGPTQTKITLAADPSAVTNRHEIRAVGWFGKLEVSLSNNPLPDNPKSSAMTALNLARSITNRTAAIVM